MLKEIKTEIAEAIANITDVANASEEQVLTSLEVPKEGFGDLSSKIAFIIAAEKKQNPMQIANKLVEKLNEKLKNKKMRFIERIETKGSYINFYFNNEFYSEAIKKILKEKEKFGTEKKKSKKIMVEFFHANTHKGVHIGHVRTMCLGEAVSRILEYSGNEVVRANYQGDIGPHVAKCLWGFLNLYEGKAPSTNRGTWLGKVYADASNKIKGNAELEKEVQEITVKLYAGDKKINDLWKKTRQWCLEDFKPMYKEFDVNFDEFYFESETQETGMKLVKDFLKKGIVKEDQGATILDLNNEDLGVCVLITKEGYPLYHTKDIGLAKLKFDKYNLDRSIHVVGKEQEFYFKQLFKAFEKIGNVMPAFEKAAKVSYHLVYELVMLPEGKMSSREGTMVLYQDLKEKLLEITLKEVKKRHENWPEDDTEKTAMQITLAAIKFSMLRRESNRVLLFNWDEALNLEGDTGPYLQYAYVRANAILEKAKEGQKQKANEKVKEKATTIKSYEFTNEEKRLIKKLCEFPELIEKSARDMAPNYLADYLIDVAGYFNKFYTTSRVLNAESDVERKTRLVIVNASSILLKNGLDLLGIQCPEKM